MPTVADNFASVRERVAAAAKRARRKPGEVLVVAVSKTVSIERIQEAYAAGLRHFGENRVQEWEGKCAALAGLADATWHLVGHLQSNKARRAAALFHAIDSLDSLALAQKLDRAIADARRPARAAAKAGASVGGDALASPLRGAGAAAKLPVLLEVRLSPEETKSGVEPSALPHVTEAVLALPHLDLRGLLGIPPLTAKPEEARPYFQRLRGLRDALARQLGRPLPELSMGMSHDLEVAIEEGATQVRIGSALFGGRG
jgi:uncharacterized pyridoxal phosphate-containing UPF0001 family protein